MIAYLPELFPGELFYSYLARYYCHTTPVYSNAIGDILEKRTIRPDIEFINRLNENARDVITKRISMKELVLEHTMFPTARFIPASRRNFALESMIAQEGDVHNLLPLPTVKKPRCLKYCPMCAMEMREVYGEAYWTRQANIRNIDVCVKHRCRLKATNIEISGKKSGRLYVADAEIEDIEPEFVDDGLELEFAQYMTDVFQIPINMENSVDIGKFLNTKLEGTKYLSTRGKMRNISLLFDDIMKFYEKLPNQGINQISQMQKIFTGYRWDFYEICQIAFFLRISTDDLVNPKLPEKSQSELFDEKVARLYDAGLGCHRIAREMGCCPSTARKANQSREKRVHDYSAARRGKQVMDWAEIDIELLPEVQKAINQIYGGGDTRPKRVTEFAVSKYMGWPDKRFNYLPECRKLVQSYFEEFPIFWAREVVWCYQHLDDTIGEEDIRWRDIRDITNLRKNNFIASFPYLCRFTNQETADKIQSLLPISDFE